MQTHPGKAILAGDHVFVERLVHVPEQHQPDFRTVLAHRFLNLRNKCNRGFTQFETSNEPQNHTLVGEPERDRVPTRKGANAISHLQAIGKSYALAELPLHLQFVRILTRYILKEVSSHALLGVLLFTFVIFMRDLGRLLELVVRNSAPLPSVAEIFLYTLPTTFTITLPMGVLVGILIGLSRLAADSEVTAIRASGMGAGMFVRVGLDVRHRRLGPGNVQQHLCRAQVGRRAQRLAGSAEDLAGLVRDSASRLLRRVQEQRPVRAGRRSVERPVAVARRLSGRHQRSLRHPRSRWPSAAHC